MKISAYFTVVALAVAATCAQAQTTMPSVGSIPPVVPGSYYGGSWYPHSSTPLEGFGRGLGEVIRSIGEANLANSAAAMNWSEVQRRDIENRKQWIDAYFAMRDTNRRYRDAEIKRHWSSPEELARYAQVGRPTPLGNRELDAVTGEIRWPILLRTKDFDSQRSQLEKLFTDRAYHGVLGAEGYLTAVRLTGDMIASLKDHIREVPPQQYLAAKKFLEGLTYEAGLVTG